MISVLLIPFILLSGVLYRIPRGGPDAATWQRWIGFSGFGSTGGRLLWAIPTGIGAVLITALPLYLVPVVAAYLWGAVALKGWGQWWPNNADGGSLWKLTVRGIPLFNPLMGVIYFATYRYRELLPRWGVALTGWTTWAELLSGFVTAGLLFVTLKAIQSVF